jgi:hypothetical protein
MDPIRRASPPRTPVPDPSLLTASSYGRGVCVSVVQTSYEDCAALTPAHRAELATRRSRALSDPRPTLLA